LIDYEFARPTGKPSIGSIFTDAQSERSIPTCGASVRLNRRSVRDQVGGQSATTVRKTVR
jgi:hypothetical protein